MTSRALTCRLTPGAGLVGGEIRSYVKLNEVPDNTSQSIGVHEKLTAEAACPSGTRLIAGGGSALPSGGDVVILENEPIGKTTWKVTVVRLNT